MKLLFTLPAQQDLASLLDYITLHSPQGAVRVHARIKSVLELVLQFPRSGSTTDDPVVRRIAVSPYPYLIFYQIEDNRIIIHSVRHSARNLPLTGSA